jgi:hypothetical protein
MIPPIARESKCTEIAPNRCNLKWTFFIAATFMIDVPPDGGSSPAADGGAPARVLQIAPADANPRQRSQTMPQADANTTTIPDATLIAEHLGELQPISCKCVADDEVSVSLTNTAGQITTFTLTTDSMMDLTNRMVAVVQNFTAQVLRDLRAAPTATGKTNHPNLDAEIFEMGRPTRPMMSGLVSAMTTRAQTASSTLRSTLRTVCCLFGSKRLAASPKSAE